VLFSTAALIVILSVFNGFESLLVNLYDRVDPDYKVVVNSGKTFELSEEQRQFLASHPEIIGFSGILEERALFRYRDREYVATVRGVDSNYFSNNRFEEIMVSGELFNGRERDLALFGQGVAYYLSLNEIDYNGSVSVFIPRMKRSLSMSSGDAFHIDNLYPIGRFSVQADYDAKYVLVPIEFLRDLLQTQAYSAIEINAIEIGNPALQEEIQNLFGTEFSVDNRREQHDFVYKIMRTEKYAIYIIFGFILLIASFNLVGSLVMLIIDKKKDLFILWSMGTPLKTLRKIFFIESLLINTVGAIGGLFLGGVIIAIQVQFGLIKLGGAGEFIVSAYPVAAKWTDFIWVLLTVISIGTISAVLPVISIRKTLIHQAKT
jgi:lipoprotein-releasing system permease protein